MSASEPIAAQHHTEASATDAAIEALNLLPLDDELVGELAIALA